jgi:hypothetical protein
MMPGAFNLFGENFHAGFDFSGSGIVHAHALVRVRPGFIQPGKK